ncbi:RNA-binding protein with serine-rich domain 1 [Tritrichomonas musculus]|uniref:RNA-binding protein with serine-rich domain 1 n=1 Tax=Tritrichomonas musculus TaxID=1915356 RepID=A0ABR2HIR0_9EUKA
MSRFKNEENDSSNYQEWTKDVLVRNLSLNVRSAHLDEIFSTFGKVKVDLGYIKGHSAGIAIIRFDKHTQALDAIEKMNEGNIDGNIITVELADPKKTIDEYIELSRTE